MAWELRGNSHYCPRHDIAFSRGEICVACNTDPGPPVDADDAAAEDHELVLREAEFRADGKFLRRKAREFLDDGTALDANAGAKLFSEGLKCERLALEVRATLSQAKRDRELIKHDREMAGLVAQH